MDTAISSQGQWYPIPVSRIYTEKVLTETQSICARVMPIRLVDTRTHVPFEVLAANEQEKQGLTELVHLVIADQIARQDILISAGSALSAEIETIIAQAAGRFV